MFYVFFFIALAAVLALGIIGKIKTPCESGVFHSKMAKGLKIAAVVYAGLCLFCIVLPDAFMLSYDENQLVLTGQVRVFALLRWFTGVAFIALPAAVLFPVRAVRNVAVYFCSTLALVSVFFYPTYMSYFESLSGKGLAGIEVVGESFKAFLRNATFRSIVFGLVKLLEIAIPVLFAVNEKHVFNVKDKKEWLNFAIVLPCLIFLALPIYVPQHLFGYSSLIFDAWSLPHILWLVLVGVETAVLFFLFRRKSKIEKKALCFVLALSLLMQYSQVFGSMTITMGNLPLQLCNIGAFLLVFSIWTENKKLVDFTVVVNVTGVLLALAVPDLDGEGLFYLYNMHFILEHTNLVIAPLLAMMFGVFPRVDKKTVKHLVVGFSIYFAAVFLLGTVTNALKSATGNSFYGANYFFMFDPAKAEELVGGLAGIFSVELRLGEHVLLYPVAQVLIFVVFTGMCIGVYYAIRGIYALAERKHAKVDKRATEN